MSGTAELAVIVLNWRNAPDTIECLESLTKSQIPMDVIVVDNDSQDGSAELVEQSGLAAHLIRNTRNAGYAGGNNLGVQFALGSAYRYVAVLNNDTIAEPETFDTLVRTCTAMDARVAVSPRITYADQPDRAWFAGGTIDAGLPRHLQPEEISVSQGVVKSETLTGCCIVATAEVWRAVGMFDEGYFLIFEDSDWSARAVDAGISLLVNHDAVLHHKVSRSFAGEPMALVSTYFYIRNGLIYHARFQRTHFPRFAWSHVIRPVLSPRRSAPGRRRFVLWALADWLRGNRGNAPERAWTLAHAIADQRSV